MKFVVSSNELHKSLSSINKAITGKSSLPILDDFLFNLKDDILELTASDLHHTMKIQLVPESHEGEGMVTIDSKRILEMLSKFDDEPLSFDIDLDNNIIWLKSDKGEYKLIGQNGNDFPLTPEPKEEELQSFNLPSSVLLKGIKTTFFATADDELRPVMNGIFFELSPDSITLVASDAHKLVRYRRNDFSCEDENSFILSKKPANFLKTNLPDDDDIIVKVSFDSQNVFITFPQYTIVSRLIEGKYPSYGSVIPDESPLEMIADKVSFRRVLERVTVVSNQASHLVKLKLTTNHLVVSGQDIDYNISGNENLECQYDNTDIQIGFKSVFLVDILNNIPTSDVMLKLSDPSRAGLIVPVNNEDENEDILMLIMPMMVNQD